MPTRSWMSTLFVFLAVLLAGTVVVGCGPGKPDAKTADVESGPMPQMGSWDGVYFNPLMGMLHLESKGDMVEGRWLRPRKDQWGELTGRAEGNLLRFEWTEYVHGLVGPNSKKSGKGYFVYSRPEGDNVDDVITGEIGRGQDEVGTPWEAVKQRNVEPDLESIQGAGTADVGGGDWDSPNEEKGEPEPPVEPDQTEDEDAPEL